VTDFDSFCKKLAETGSRRGLFLRAGAGVLGALAWVSAGSRASAGSPPPDDPSAGSPRQVDATSAGSTPPCGDANQPCCAGNACNAGLGCVSPPNGQSTCTDINAAFAALGGLGCGGVGEPCCQPGNVCNGGVVCGVQALQCINGGCNLMVACPDAR